MYGLPSRSVSDAETLFRSKRFASRATTARTGAPWTETTRPTFVPGFAFHAFPTAPSTYGVASFFGFEPDDRAVDHDHEPARERRAARPTRPSSVVEHPDADAGRSRRAA